MTSGTVRFFCIFFAAALFPQAYLWQSVNFVDEGFWLNKVSLLKEDLFNGPLIFDAERYASHPGTLVLIPAAVAAKAGLSATVSIRMAVIVLNSAAAAAAASVARQARKGGAWWLGLGGVLLFNPVYENVNPLDPVVSSLSVLAFLLLLRHLDTRQKSSPRDLAVLGLVLGAAAAARLHVTLLLAIAIGVGLAYSQSLKKAGVVCLWALLATALLIPYLWFSPLVFFARSSSRPACLLYRRRRRADGGGAATDTVGSYS